jgi:hypothetical protein
LIVAACLGYARRDRILTLNAGNDAEGAWIALNKPELADDGAQRVALEFNKERENVLKEFTQGLREALKAVFENGVERPRGRWAPSSAITLGTMTFCMKWSIPFTSGRSAGL